MAVVYVHASGFAVCLSVYASVRVVMHSALLPTDLMTATAASLASNPVLPKEHPLKASKQAKANNVCLGTFTNHYHLITKPFLKSASSLISLRCWSVAHANVCPTPSLRFYFMSERCCLAGRLDHQHWVHSRRDGLRTHGCICRHQVGSQRLESQLL